MASSFDAIRAPGAPGLVMRRPSMDRRGCSMLNHLGTNRRAYLVLQAPNRWNVLPDSAAINVHPLGGVFRAAGIRLKTENQV